MTPEQRSNAWQTAVTVLQEAMPPDVAPGSHAMTVAVEFPPGDPGTPPYRHSGPAFGYVLEGEMLFELEGEAPRVVKDVKVRFLVTMLCTPGQPMLTLVEEDELIARRDRRVLAAKS